MGKVPKFLECVHCFRIKSSCKLQQQPRKMFQYLTHSETANLLVDRCTKIKEWSKFLKVSSEWEPRMWQQTNLMNSESKSHALKKHVVHCRIFFHCCFRLKFHSYPLHVHLCQLYRPKLYLLKSIWSKVMSKFPLYETRWLLCEKFLKLIAFSVENFFSCNVIKKNHTLLIIPLSSIQSAGIWNSLQLRINESLVRTRL